jgi:hypothetical protein
VIFNEKRFIWLIALETGKLKIEQSHLARAMYRASGTANRHLEKREGTKEARRYITSCS